MSIKELIKIGSRRYSRPIRLSVIRQIAISMMNPSAFAPLTQVNHFNQHKAVTPRRVRHTASLPMISHIRNQRSR